LFISFDYEGLFVKCTTLLACSLLLLIAFGKEAQGTLLAVRYSGQRTTSDIILVDEVNLTVSVLASSGTLWMNSLARDNQGWFWTAAPSTNPAVPLNERYLIRINPITGQTTTGPKLNPTPNSSADYDALAFSPDGTLYGMDPGDRLVTINMTTGNATYIGRVGVPGNPMGIQGMTFTPDGKLYGYGVDLRGGFVRINPADATWEYLSNIPRDVQALTSAPNGDLYGARYELFRVNKTNGNLTTLMFGLGDVRGIDFVTTLVPEPASLASASFLAVCAIFAFRRRFRRLAN
jgi:hypothetical protein